MINNSRIHTAQAKILGTLRHVTRARYSELLGPSELENDRFKYHLQFLMRHHLIQKDPDGLYELSAEGKEFVNRLNVRTGYEIAGPKASLLLLVRSESFGNTMYLAHCRKREPFRDFWGIASTPVLRGVPVAQAATRELLKQTGIVAEFTVRGSQRVIDNLANGTVLEDKLFSLLVADVAGCPLPHEWYGGTSEWMTKDQLLSQPRLFPTTVTTLEMVEHNETFRESICTYAAEDY